MLKKGFFVHTELSEEEVNKLFSTKVIGKVGDLPIKKQIPSFENKSLTFCSYFCEGYEKGYHSKGIVFQTKEKPIYAIPTDSWSFMRSGVWLPNHEQFVFNSIEEMLEKYPKGIQFEKDFQKYFQKLSPEEVYPTHSKQDAELFYEMDYCNKSIKEKPYNEVAFLTPVKIEPLAKFSNYEELYNFWNKFKE
ncbi:hypothetical protein GW932_00590 [archaeon]|nr:hypothetical protein [archaeon]